MKTIIAKTKLRKYPIYINPKAYKDFEILVRKRFNDAEKIALVTNDRVFGIYENKVCDNEYGIYFTISNSNEISNNNSIFDNSVGIIFDSSQYNKIEYNSIFQIIITES